MGVSVFLYFLAFSRQRGFVAHEHAAVGGRSAATTAATIGSAPAAFGVTVTVVVLRRRASFRATVMTVSVPVPVPVPVLVMVVVMVVVMLLGRMLH